MLRLVLWEVLGTISLPTPASSWMYPLAHQTPGFCGLLSALSQVVLRAWPIHGLFLIPSVITFYLERKKVEQETSGVSYVFEPGVQHPSGSFICAFQGANQVLGSKESGQHQVVKDVPKIVHCWVVFLSLWSSPHFHIYFFLWECERIRLKPRELSWLRQIMWT